MAFHERLSEPDFHTDKQRPSLSESAYQLYQELPQTVGRQGQSHVQGNNLDFGRSDQLYGLDGIQSVAELFGASDTGRSARLLREGNSSRNGTAEDREYGIVDQAGSADHSERQHGWAQLAEAQHDLQTVGTYGQSMDHPARALLNNLRSRVELLRPDVQNPGQYLGQLDGWNPVQNTETWNGWHPGQPHSHAGSTAVDSHADGIAADNSDCNDEAGTKRVWGDPHLVADDGSQVDDQIAAGSDVLLLKSKDGNSIIGETGKYDLHEDSAATVFTQECISLSGGNKVIFKGDGTAYHYDADKPDHLGEALKDGEIVTGDDPDDKVTYSASNKTLSYSFKVGTDQISGALKGTDSDTNHSDYVDTTIDSATGKYGGLMPAMKSSFKDVSTDLTTGEGAFTKAADGHERTNEDFLVDSLYGPDKPGPDEPGPENSDVDSLFTRLDANSNQQITYKEWVDAHEAMDRDKDGSLSQSDLEAKLGKSSATAALFKAEDENNDGQLNANEWTAAFGRMESTRDSDVTVAISEFREFLKGNDLPPAPGPNDGSLEASRERLYKTLEENFSGDRLERIDNMMTEFEQRGKERVEARVLAGHDRATEEKEWNEKIKKTYDNLNDMVDSDSSSAPFDQATRANLAENALYLVMEPSKSNQGQHGTCWIESEINLLGLTNHPDDMTRLLKEVATTGSYTDTDGQKYNVPNQLLQFPGEEKSWTISNADNGLRSPVGAIFDRTVSYLEGRTDGGTNGGTPEEAALLMKKVTGDTVQQIVPIRDNNLSQSDIDRITSSQYRQAMLEQGGVINLGPGHMFVTRLVKNNGEWDIVGDNQWGAQNDQLIGRVTNLDSWNVQTTQESFRPDSQDFLRIADDTPIGVNSQSCFHSNDTTGSGAQQGLHSVIAFHSDQTEVYDDYNPDYNLDVPGGNGEIEIPDGAKINTQFSRRDTDERKNKMILRWQEHRNRKEHRDRKALDDTSNKLITGDKLMTGNKLVTGDKIVRDQTANWRNMSRNAAEEGIYQ
jgi:hypothetical protein